MYTRLTTVATLGLLSLVIARTGTAQEFDPGPLRAPAVFAANSLPTEGGPFLAWLAANGHALPEEGIVAAREQLYAILGADAKRRSAAGLSVLPSGPDTLVAHLFEWGHRLGLPGARLVSRRLGYSPAPNDLEPIATTGFRIAFDSAFAAVADADGWMVRFPDYFMIGTATRQVLGNGAETSVLVLSTLFARDSSESAGASQATIMLLSARAEPTDMTAFWLQQLEIQLGDTVANIHPSALRTYRVHDAAARMTRELVVFAPAGRTLLAVYIGNDGTYETNRPHFLNVLNTLRIRSGS